MRAREDFRGEEKYPEKRRIVESNGNVNIVNGRIAE